MNATIPLQSVASDPVVRKRQMGDFPKTALRIAAPDLPQLLRALQADLSNTMTRPMNEGRDWATAVPAGLDCP